MARPLYLHIGRHKTGSTSIQTLMERERDIFLINDIYPVQRSDYAEMNILTRETKRTSTNLFDLANLIIRKELMNGPRMRGIVPDRDHDEIIRITMAVNKILHNLPREKILMSTEGFSNLRTPQEGNYVKALFKDFDLKVMLIEREQESWTLSYKGQISKLQKRFAGQIGEKDTMFDFSPGSWQFDLSGLKAIFPQADLFDYDTLMNRDGSILPSFLTWLNLDLAKFENLDIWENVRTHR